MLKFLLALALAAILSPGAASAQSLDPVFSAKRFTAAVGLRRQWVNEFDSPEWHVALPVSYRASKNTYLNGQVVKSLNQSEYTVAVGFSWRFISAGKNTWQQ